MIGLLLACAGGEEPIAEPVAEPVVVEPARPDVLVIVVDTLRADRLGAWGHERPTSPFMDSLAAEGVRFADATIPASWTYPGHAALFTGQPPWVNGAHHSHVNTSNTGTNKSVEAMRAEVPTLAEQLADAGYTTISIAGNNVVSADSPLLRGFQLTRGPLSDDEVVQSVQQVAAVKDAQGPAFVFVNLMSAHAPYERTDAPWLSEQDRSWWTPGVGPDWMAPYHRNEGTALTFNRTPAFGPRHPQSDTELPPEAVEFIGRVYDGGVLQVDGYVEQVVTAWRAAHPDSLVVLTSDHGEYLGEHGLLVHHSTAYRPVTWVPLIVSWPGHLEPGVVETPVAAERMAPTVLELLGLPGAERSLVPLIEGGAADEPIQARSWVDSHRAKRHGGIFQHVWSQYRVGDLAYVFSSGGHQELYDISDDPTMLRDRASERPEDLAELVRASEGAFDEAENTTPAPDLDEALRALGYLD